MRAMTTSPSMKSGCSSRSCSNSWPLKSYSGPSLLSMQQPAMRSGFNESSDAIKADSCDVTWSLHFATAAVGDPWSTTAIEALSTQPVPLTCLFDPLQQNLSDPIIAVVTRA
eukprot:CAMPEP_0197695914 /NCGR_PEP_ID=MMETSP1338-20131121/115869_1 /TAXON_ID=43686 ORGANISM="Pelagodinium beii, Strain RCC1491" /NCGR_SAMPLE_ID=MMETSP1338 /ASSEMBLY_ACC=CAM_ASM_000754 /LENGTH=111 /DNA_ID=CAMNT_0043278959 /DNA_START=95 /DNA_END=429 /DNA_ORIENTATION=+